jgi:hypothetical protein
MMVGSPMRDTCAYRKSARMPTGSCIQGFVWREANSTDHLCVTPQTRSQTAADNGAQDIQALPLFKHA